MGNKPRGIRNNNPGNIRISQSKWQGKLPVEENTDGSFEQFSSPVMGIRALARLLLTYNVQGINTISGIIKKYAPPNENNTNKYVTFVAIEMGKSKAEILDFDDYETMLALVKAIINKENGNGWADHYSENQYRTALNAAGVHNVQASAPIAKPEVQVATAVATTGVVTVAGSAVQAVQPALPLLQQIIGVAPWAVGIILIGLGGYLAYSFYQARKAGQKV